MKIESIDSHQSALLEGVRIAIQKAGSQNKLAKLLGTGQPKISNWLHRDKKIPFSEVNRISKLLKIPRHILRPDCIELMQELPEEYKKNLKTVDKQ